MQNIDDDISYNIASFYQLNFTLLYDSTIYINTNIVGCTLINYRVDMIRLYIIRYIGADHHHLY